LRYLPSFPTRRSSDLVVGARRLLDAVARFVDDRLDDAPQIAGLSIDGELPIRARAVGEDRADILNLAAAPELVDDIVDKREELERELAHRHLGAAAEVDQLAVEAPARRTPFVLLDQAAVIHAKSEIARPQLIQLDDDRLGERGDGNRGARRRRHVADPELE